MQLQSHNYTCLKYAQDNCILNRQVYATIHGINLQIKDYAIEHWYPLSLGN